MTRNLVAFCVVLLFGSSAIAKLEIRNVQAAHGILGPERTSLECYPLDEIVFRFVADDVQLDADGRTDMDLSFRLVNSEGKAVINEKGPIQRPLMLGGNTFTAHTTIGIGANAAAGDYELTVTLHDKISAQSASFTRKLTCKSSQFQILAPRFFRDPEGKIPASLSGIVGESLFFRLKAVGIDRSQSKVHATMTMQVIDDKGSEMLPKPYVVNAELTRAEDVQRAMQLNFNGAVSLNRAGKYKIRVMVQDHIAKQTTTFETALVVAAP